jgi:chitinase
VNPNYGPTVALNIYNLFLGGSSPYRPFGDAIVDGIDIHVWNNNRVGVFDFVEALRSLMGHSSILTGTALFQFVFYVAW